MSADAVVMLLTLRIISAGGKPIARAQAFGPGGGTVGRSPECDLMLDDPSKFISRVQAKITYRDGSFLFTDLGANHSMLNDRSLGDARAAVLAHRDQLVIGDYALEVSLEPAKAAPLLQPGAPTPPLFAGAPAAAALANAVAIASSQPEPLGLNLFGGMIDTPPPAGAGPNAYRGAESDHISPETQLMGNLGKPSGAGYEAIPDDYDPLRGMRPTGTAQRSAPARARDAGEDAIVQALLSGLGLPHLQINRSAVDLAQLVGSMLREATAGTMAVLLARSLTKRESRIDRTMLAQQANNPLKFFPDASSALTQMLTGASGSYLSPVRAMSNAYDDLRAHELAVMAATRAALSDILDQLSPEAIERRAQANSALDKVFATSRKARLWDSLVEAHNEISLHADEDFQRYFNEKFSAAYEEQMIRIRRAALQGA